MKYIVEIKDDQMCGWKRCDADESYYQGLRDAWNLTKKIMEMSADLRTNIFGAILLDIIYANNSPTDAIKKIKCHEEKEAKEIKMGDWVVRKYNRSSGSMKVTLVKEDTVYVICQDGKCFEIYKSDIEKTLEPNQKVIDLLKRINHD